MQFTSHAQKQAYERIYPWVREIFGPFATPWKDLPVFQIITDTTEVQVRVEAWSQDDSTISTRAVVVRQISLSKGLMRYLLQENDKLRFGAFGIDRDENIIFEHTIAGSTCGKDELKGSIMAVVITTGEYANQIIERWGGQRNVVDFIDEELKIDK